MMRIGSRTFRCSTTLSHFFIDFEKGKACNLHVAQETFDQRCSLHPSDTDVLGDVRESRSRPPPTNHSKTRWEKIMKIRLFGTPACRGSRCRLERMTSARAPVLSTTNILNPVGGDNENPLSN